MSMNYNEMNLRSICQRLIYDYPLYNYVIDKTVNILVIGDSPLTQCFIDVALESTQSADYKPSVTFVSKCSNNVKESYLNSRPAFNRFFDVDHSATEDSYGNLNFANVKEYEVDQIEDFLLNSEQKYICAFIDCGNYSLNKQMAEVCNNYFSLTEACPLIAYYSKNNSSSKFISFNKNYTIENLDRHQYRKLRQMAFNCHLVWNNNPNLDIRKLQREFNSKYCYEGSMEYVLSLKSKLNCVGIDFNSQSVVDEFKALSREQLDLLSWIEHKRWVTNMVCKGWKAERNLKKLATLGSNKDKKNKYHLCLVKSNIKRLLDDYAWKKSNYARWSDASENLKELDALDKNSVNLYREYKRLAKNVVFPKEKVEYVDKLLQNEKEPLDAFNNYIFCLKELFANQTSKTGLYDYYKARLEKSVNGIKNNNLKKSLKNELKSIFDLVAPITKAPTDYKRIDYDLIIQTPFIFTYKTNFHVGAPMFVDSKSVSNQASFNNVRLILRLKPSSVTYFYDFDCSDNSISKQKTIIAKELESILCAISIYNGFRTKINLCFWNDDKDEIFIQELKNLSKNINRIDYLENANGVREFIKNRRIDALEKNRSETGNRMIAYYGEDASWFDFKRAGIDINKSQNCDFINYIPFKSYLKINDIFAHKNATITTDLPDVSRNYNDLFNVYSQDKNAWKKLCNSICKICTSELVKIENSYKEIKKEKFVVINEIKPTLEYIFEKYKVENKKFKYDFEKNGNNVQCLSIEAQEDVLCSIETLLSFPDKLLSKNNLDVFFDKGIFTVNHKSLYVKELNIAENIKSYERILNSLKHSKDIVSLKINKNLASFTFSNYQISSIMTNAGRLLEIYIYYNLIDKFDDVATSVLVQLNDDGVTNEFDVLATYGYKSVFIECKATSLDQNYYTKIDSLSNYFSINTIPVIIADTNPNYTVNKIQYSRGEAMDVATIFDVDNIADKILEIMRNY